VHYTNCRCNSGNATATDANGNVGRQRQPSVRALPAPLPLIGRAADGGRPQWYLDAEARFFAECRQLRRQLVDRGQCQWMFS
jgi:hypothetical protein